MKMRSGFHHPVSLFAIMALLVASIAWVPQQKECHKINAKAKGQTLSKTMGGATTVEDIIGGGILNGKIRGEFIFTAPPDPVTGVMPFVGTFVLTTRHGVLTFNVSNGVFNTVTGEFGEDLTADDGTGRFSNATGSLSVNGLIDLSTGNYTEDIDGEICLH